MVVCVHVATGRHPVGGLGGTPSEARDARRGPTALAVADGVACASTAASGTPVFAASLVAHTNPRPSPIGVGRSTGLGAPTHGYVR